MSQISLKDVSKRYRVGNTVVRAVEHLSMEIERGEFVVILGPSGSGKTTLLNLLGGLERADEGSICIDGEWVNQMDEKALINLRGIVRTTYKILNGQTFQNLEGFAPEADWAELSLTEASVVHTQEQR